MWSIMTIGTSMDMELRSWWSIMTIGTSEEVQKVVSDLQPMAEPASFMRFFSLLVPLAERPQRRTQ